MIGSWLSLLVAQALASAAPSPFLLFFDSGEPELSRDALAIADSAAAAVRQAGPLRIELVGHSDRSGPPAANRIVALRRAEAVRAALTARGVPATIMIIRSAGEAEPIIATPDGVREPQNRRVEVHLIPAAGR